MADPAQTLAERIGGWVAWTDAVALSAALAVDAAMPTQLPRDDAEPAVLTGDVRRLHDHLARDIADDAVLSDGAGPPAADPERLRSRYLAHQQTMHDAIPPLRQRLRAALSARSAGQARLAAIDAALEQALAGRERALLASVPLLAERSPLADSPGETPGPGSTMQRLLLAELAIRMAPIDGMVAALTDENTLR